MSSNEYQKILGEFAKINEIKIKEWFKKPADPDIVVDEGTLEELPDTHIIPKYYQECLTFQTLNRSPAKWFLQADYNTRSKVWRRCAGKQLKYGDFSPYVRLMLWIKELPYAGFKNGFGKDPNYAAIYSAYITKNETSFFLGLEPKYQKQLADEFHEWQLNN